MKEKIHRKSIYTKVYYMYGIRAEYDMALLSYREELNFDSWIDGTECRPSASVVPVNVAFYITYQSSI